MADAASWVGLHEAKVQETLKNSSLCKLLVEIVALAKQHLNEPSIDKQKGNFLYQLCTKIKPQCHKFLPLVVKHIVNGGIRNDAQFAAALSYLLEKSTEEVVNEAEFEARCGVGIIITSEEIENKVAEIIEKHKQELVKERYNFNIGKLLAEVRQLLTWADGAAVKREVDLQVLNLLGPKTDEDLHSKAKKKSAPQKEPTKAEAKNLSSEVGKSSILEKASEETAESMEELLRNCTQFHKVGENFKTEGYVVTPNTMKHLQKHAKAVNGKVVTRFPPEPNGVLHIGHAKAININFGLAKALGGKCILRYDDTNPEKEEEKFFNAIKDIVEWLGYQPWKITHSSDYFDQLYKWAVELIRKGHAYVCHQNVEEMRGFDAKPSSWRDRPTEESLKLFEQMKNGLFDEGEATLRMKIILEEGKMDPVAYRIKYLPHHRTKDKWCIYPTYDYTHCLCDSIENITHSLCTKEFQSRRSSYYWLCNALDIYCPVQWEYSRLNIDNTVLSKRKILKLTETGVVSDWDDPRLFTLSALRRRGIPPEAINKFVAKLGLTVAQTTIRSSLLDAVVRDYLNVHAPRTMAVLEPLKISIMNFDELASPSSINVPDFPPEISTSNTDSSHSIAFDNVVFIEKADFEEDGSKGFRRLTKKQSVGLKHIGLILEFVSVEKNENGEIVKVCVNATKATDSNSKPKAFIHWVSKPESCEVRTYDQLEKDVEDGSEELCIPPMKIFPNALIDRSVRVGNSRGFYQFERTGFYGIDTKDSTKQKIIFNQVVALKDTSKKN